MSDTQPGNEPSSNPVPPMPPAPSAQPAAPAYGAAPAQPKKALAITGMALGIAGLVLSWVPFLGVGLALVGLVLSIIALVKKQPKAFSITGLVTSIVGLIIGAIVTITVIWALGAGVDAVQQCMNGAEFVEIAGQTVSCSDVNY
ncbi:hypothetical protein [Leucobacter tenebrionis]|uniref:hypothetical protein n=1 Tax=Leucobacter tenebrionis TaxID=2873270 RepID=UPI001CA79432|nr:hypothetical protein [Leucobacter tenebrionis]QZY52754.1 hypothetical protein KVY00_04735 [Leucobacter tenebrionis]